MKIAYLDCFSGVSGDMLVGSLVDAGLPFEELKRIIYGLNLDGYTISAKKEGRNNIFGTKFYVSLKEKHQKARYLKDIKEIITNSDIPLTVVEKCVSIFEKLAITEGEIHHISPDEIHFHEVGAVDSIIDIVASVAGIYLLGIEKLFVSRMPVGKGIITSAHGKIPLPSPATIALLEGVPIYDSGQEVEMITPTGAALITSLCSSFGPMPSMIVERVGYGVGSRTLADRPNLLRILIGNDIDKRESETVVVLESNLDDMSPELLGYLMDRLFDAGAKDVSFSHIQMKKNRPGIQLQVVGQPEDKDKLSNIIFKESTTLGIRFNYSQRSILTRGELMVESPWGKMRVKKVINQGGKTAILPEYEECRRVAKANNLALRDIYAWVAALPSDHLK
ncbi:MAG: nickel pincer cofactor biosynthesis protein LarC [Deltaproteobacteria bacterium]|nr:nickel pincer cofactor biosynthesis protein LarC [Deltaproteobacteria bacterium]OQY17096.1 MAG: TIGR00299 family protein [Desulfobacterium sp. 4572_20]HDH86702.1 nickel pincer cofactor biosynthesis protein LarC [Desulfobacteraceae bacterium]MBW2104698.1 nickel pincer cofactor biosynthesis protein LarC [Deltaproteobacteria bacterium]MBW2331966.1 nickel pincer cofactor biosynthesis protein LarC [Deltaproteobacteria bacterium]